jgi:hypothetical protein
VELREFGGGYLDVEYGADVRYYGSPSRTGVLEVLAFFRPWGKCTDARVSEGLKGRMNPDGQGWSSAGYE